MGRVAVLACAILLGAMTGAQAAPPPTVTPATDGILAAFQTHPLVGLGEWHGMAQEEDFYSTLIRDPRFAQLVGNVVVEMGDAAQQAVVDRYVNGEKVPYAELRKVWADTVGIFPTVRDLGTINLYAAIRAVNAGLPPQSRIRIWLGDPPIEWSKVNTKEEWQVLEDQRDSYPTALIEREILAKGKKALVIYGAGHFAVLPGGLPLPSPVVRNRTPNMRALFDRRHPGALYTISPYIGYTTAACMAAFEKHLPGISAPALVYPVHGSSLEKDVARPGCSPMTKIPEYTQEEHEQLAREFAGQDSDALLYLGPRKSLLESPTDSDLTLDLDFRAEVNRRMQLRVGTRLKAPDPAYNTAVPHPMFEN